MVDDKLGTPTYTVDFARNVELLLAAEYWGVYNLICAGVTSRLEVAQYLVEALGLAGTVPVTPVSSDYFASRIFRRPAGVRATDPQEIGIARTVPDARLARVPR